MTRAWTLGYPPAYERAIRIPGNTKAPGGYVFPTRAVAIERSRTHLDAARYDAYEIELPAPYAECVTRDLRVSMAARHAWHKRLLMEGCWVCYPPASWPDLDHDVLIVAAPFVVPT